MTPEQRAENLVTAVPDHDSLWPVCVGGAKVDWFHSQQQTQTLVARLRRAIAAAITEVEAELLPLLADRVLDSDLARHAVERERAKFVTLLRRLQWSGEHEDGWAACPLCGAVSSYTHKSDCELAALLRDAD